MRTQLEFYCAGSEVMRYHTVHTIQRETVGHHSHGVAMLCYLLQPTCSAELLRAALLHDLSEHLTGDIPSPAKRLYGIGEQVSHIEEELLEGSGLSFPVLSAVEKRVLKLADLAQGALFCAREMQLGNTKLRLVFDRYMSYANEFTLVGRECDLFQAISEMTE